ncbi:MAG: type II secretion system GspH family protein [Deltaproteobacteria bacterium]|jgi:type II secretory pathway pseudopilin PulG|nr:type II secretion system GspH family protein [Deltaproteobacteria bacterium]
MPNQLNIRAKGQRPGMIMVFVIVVMMITSLMGLVIMVNTKAEVTTSGRQRQSMEAFNAADSAAKMANLFARVLLHPVLQAPNTLLTPPPTSGPASPMTVEFNNARFDMEVMFEESIPFKYKSRYLETGMTSSSPADPHIVFKVGGKEVASAVITLDSSNAITSGYSLNAADLYDKAGGPSVPVDMVVTVRGSTTTTPGDQGATPRSLITTIMRELL